LAKKKFVDIAISFKDIELTNFTPYSSKYLGYKIEKGKLLLDLDYQIDGDTLKSENKVLFDNFELGEKVESEYATSLPVGLAISLLKNADGQIDLDLPVTGQLNDPEFKFGSVIFSILSNLIVKVVTSPFAVIGAMFGGGEELGYVDFGYGEDKVNEADFEKLAKLTRILKEKPSINLEIQGSYDKLRDAEGLRARGFNDLVKAEKLKEMVADGKNVETLDDVVLEDEDMQEYIEKAYEEALFPKPRDDDGDEKELLPEEKKKLLITNIEINPNDLRLLAMERSENIKGYFITTGEIERERIFLLEPDGNENSENSDATGTTGASKAKFSLK
jgi:hypothetical protein